MMSEKKESKWIDFSFLRTLLTFLCICYLAGVAFASGIKGKVITISYVDNTCETNTKSN